MLSDEQKRVLDLLLDGELSDSERAVVLEDLESDPEAIDWLAGRAMMHVNLHRAIQRRGIEAEAKSTLKLTKSARRTRRTRTRTTRPARLSRRMGIGMSIAATLVAMFILFVVSRPPADQTFATLEQTRAALWESGDLSTADGSRLAQGTLRLAEGLATVRFDSGAEVVLEAPATLTLVDAMNCTLTRGTAVSDIPDSALGFRIKTPSADVVDYGTIFAVSVDEGTGGTHTQVIEGRVQVEDANSDEVVELTTGQHNTVGETFGEAADDAGYEHKTFAVEPAYLEPGWVMLEPTKDAYTGRVPGHNSEVMLLVKKGMEGGHRIAYIGFDLEDINQKRIEEAELRLHFAPTGFGLASLVPDATFSVYGMVGDDADWDESILHQRRFPGDPKVIHVGSFTVPQGVQKGPFSVRTEALSKFLRDHKTSQISFRVMRDTVESNIGGLVHGFASRRHPVLPPPTLVVRTDEASK